MKTQLLRALTAEQVIFRKINLQLMIITVILTSPKNIQPNQSINTIARAHMEKTISMQISKKNHPLKI
jgi:hypothetical protein